MNDTLLPSHSPSLFLSVCLSVSLSYNLSLSLSLSLWSTILFQGKTVNHAFLYVAILILDSPYDLSIVLIIPVYIKDV